MNGSHPETKDEQVKTEEALDRLGLQGLANRKPAELSGGQQARLTLARALLQRRRWLLLDEPFAALGPALRREMLDVVTMLCAETGTGLLMVTHNPDDAARACPQTLVVADGRAAPPAPTQTILADPPPALRDYLGH